MSTDLDILPSIINHGVGTPTTTALAVEVSAEPKVDTELKRVRPTKEIVSNSNNYPTSALVGNVRREDDPITPTSDEFKIPAPRSPPPAPRKRRCGVAVACRKKLDFLDRVNHPQLIIPKEEVIQEFFTSSFDQIHRRTLVKRRCPCI